MKNNTLIKALIITLLLFTFLTGNGQVIREIQDNFVNQNSFREKLFVHTDKSVYLPGEILWFKIYCVDEKDHKPSGTSKLAYVDILDASQNYIAQAKISLVNGVGSGSIYVPITVTNGNYKFRAYTNWMKNFGADFYFEKMITLINPVKTPEAIVKLQSPVYDIQFFPEGGNLVAGIPSKVAFKVVGQSGKGVACTGIIINQNKDTIAHIRSFKFGMGTFSFAPVLGNTYKAIIKIGSSSPIIQALPEPAAHGYVMHLTDESVGQLKVDVTGKGTGDGTLYLFVHTGQSSKIALSAAIVAGAASYTIDKSLLGEGISHLTVFNDARQPVCERLYFKRPKQKLQITATAEQQQYESRKKVSVTIAAKDLAGQALDPDLSISVYRIDSLQDIDRGNIFAYLWLNSDLKGTIESPEYYFNTVNAESNEALDNLMLTQGWRKFSWAQAMNNKPPIYNFYPEYSGHIITGKIVNALTGAPAKEILTYLGIPGKRVQLYTSESDSLGRLYYYTKDFYGANELVAQTNQLVDSSYRIDISSPFSEQYSKTMFPKYHFSETAIAALQEHNLGTQVLNIYSAANIKRFYEPQIDSLGFFGRPFKSYKLDDFTRFVTMEEDLREFVAEDNIAKRKGKFHIKVFNGQQMLDGDPLCLVDGIPLFDIDKVMAIDPLKIRKLDVVNERYYYGPSDQFGVFSFTSYKGDFGGAELDPHAIVTDYEGIQLRREFYTPVYDTEAKAKSRLPDFRNLLYWSPSVTAKGKDAVSFYTSDQPGKYIGVVQGITNTGNAGVQYFTFDVK